MTSPREREGYLAPYKVLDLSDHRGLLAGHMLAQLGADVVQLETPRGSSGRRHPPFCESWPEGENSFYWAAYASGKRSLVCDPGTDAGAAVFAALVRQADFLIESFAPAEGRPDWIDPERVAAINPDIVHVSITPFGLTGPKMHWLDAEITLWAAGGPMLGIRDDAGTPLRVSAPQAYLHAAGDAAGGAMIAHFARVGGAGGQHVDISVQQSVPQATLSVVLAAGVNHANLIARPPPPGAETGQRPLDLTGSGALTVKTKWAVRDGLAEMHVAMGPAVGQSTNAFFAWMRDEGAPNSPYMDWDWTKVQDQIAAGEISMAEWEAARESAAAFMATREKGELMRVSLERGLRIAPVQTTADILNDEHEAARGFLQTVHGPFGDYVLPGDFAMGGRFRPLTPAPRLGEHTAEVLADWLGWSEARIASAGFGGYAP
jgi:crotonobetainyl-CoA:carnitine CoA-transferase CaiB-like acyl-CoA transferase